MSVGKAESTPEVFDSRSNSVQCLWAVQGRLPRFQTLPHLSATHGPAWRAPGRYQGKLVN
jgi:hypothetical protein